ncbi:MAG: type I-F CRISPR-associated protein Csy2 [Pseudomonadota bacterium]|nr:type I-F CRISPR-associated protein Csy2 [Pseudomonadota bacterium]
MSGCPNFTHLLVLPQLCVQNANAISSPLTHGFPAITAFTGLMWALQRRLQREGIEGLCFKAVGVVCHQHQEQVSDGYVKSFSLSRNPIGKDGKAAAIVEEGRIHLRLSLVFAVDTLKLGIDDAEDVALAGRISELLSTMRIAGGSVLPNQSASDPYWVAMTGDAKGREANFKTLRLRLLPGFALVSRDDLLKAELQTRQQHDADATLLDAWLSRSRRNHYYDADEGGWTHDRRTGSGWIVPIPVGYTALTDVQPAGSVANARDADTPFRFVEGLYSLGQWLSPHRIEQPRQLLWYPDANAESGHYRCRNDFITPPTEADQTDWSAYYTY